jgi:osmotically-inducible protein OsmY
LVDRIKTALATDERSGLTDVVVEVIEGIVYLRGEVESEADSAAAVAVAAEVEGVREVRSHLSLIKIRPPNTVRVELPDSRPFADDAGGRP